MHAYTHLHTHAHVHTHTHTHVHHSQEEREGSGLIELTSLPVGKGVESKFLVADHFSSFSQDKTSRCLLNKRKQII